MNGSGVCKQNKDLSFSAYIHHRPWTCVILTIYLKPPSATACVIKTVLSVYTLLMYTIYMPTHHTDGTVLMILAVWKREHSSLNCQIKIIKCQDNGGT